MADLTITIAESMRVFGGGPTTKWSTYMTWGSSKWGEGSINVLQDAQKVFAESIASADLPAREVGKLFSAGDIALSDAPSLSLGISLQGIDAGSIASSDGLGVKRYDGLGYLFARLPISPAYDAAATVSTDWTRTSAAVTTWDES